MKAFHIGDKVIYIGNADNLNDDLGLSIGDKGVVFKDGLTVVGVRWERVIRSHSHVWFVYPKQLQHADSKKIFNIVKKSVIMKSILKKLEEYYN